MKIIPFGDRILCKRRIIGEKAGKIFLPDEVKERATDLADVIYVPDLTFADRQILDNSDKIVSSLTAKASEGDSDALIALLEINKFIKYKSIRAGDGVMISKYVGTDFHATGEKSYLTLVREDDIIGLIREDK